MPTAFIGKAHQLEDVAHAKTAQSVQEAIALLSEREQLVIKAFFFEEKPLLEVAHVLGVTDSRVSQIKREALARLRETLLPFVADGGP
jgi:RNA polymerase sigma factor for flagellar operon FliA